MFDRQNFKNYVGIKSGNSYASGLATIEIIHNVDLDKEFENDECASLLLLLEESKKENIADENEIHKRRDRYSHLRKYIEFMKKQENVHYNTIKDLINRYKHDFEKINEQERYKWEAVKHYKDNWNIDASDFAGMLEKAFAKTYNLLAAGQYYARKMLVGISKEHPEEVRSLFKILYNESLPLENRFDDFRAGFDEFVSERGISHYQDLHAVSVYLTFEYPEKYYIYKFGVYDEYREYVDKPLPAWIKKHETSKIKYNNMLLDELVGFIKADNELILLSQNRLDDNCYNDPEYHLLAFDIMFYASHQKDTDNWWPSLEQYNPNLSKEDWKKYILEVEKPNHPSPMQMLKAMMELGGVASCKQLSQKFGGTTSYYVGCTMNLGRRVKKHFNLPPCMDGEQERYFPFPFLGKALDDEEGHQYLYRIRPELYEALNEIDLSDINPYYEEGETLKTNSIAKNTILYGPPGTGKTYNTACYAVAIIENKDVEEVLEEAKDNYSAVFERYNSYKNEGLVEFVTFHQSYGYEDFIEGIKPVLEADDEEQSDLQYKVTDGVFKAFCNTARNPISKNKVDDYGLNKNPTVWKVSLWSTGDNPIRTECMEKGHIRIGWDDYGPEITSETDFSEIGGRNVLNSFIYKMQKGDIVLSCYSNTTIDAIGVVTGDYEWSGEYDDLNRLRKVNWLVKGIEENIVEMNGGTVFTLAAVYKANVSVADALSIVEKYSDLTPIYENKKQNMVFIIDEINRGNISKIFGELITLVEDSKRIGADEELKVVLPYSQKSFGVPDNVYILGTMNTADRSIAALDTALRRRFSFVEMMPDSEILENVIVEGVNISQMLTQINKRIEILFDREHTIGHAYFINLTNSSKIHELGDVFKNRIIPLLQEYFYEDYERIRLVLADNQVEQGNRELQFITSEDVEVSKLFGNTDETIFDEMRTFVINKDALNNPLAYKKIYE